MTKNLTLAIDEALLDRARVVAALKRTSVNAMIRDFLERLVEAEKGKDEAREALLKLIDESEANFADRPFTREEAGSGSSRFDRFNR